MAPQDRAIDRRSEQREKLIACAETAIIQGGLPRLRARSLSDCVGCSVGAIYNLVTDLDELVLLVGQRTMAALNSCLDAAGSSAKKPDLLVAWSLAYCAYAVANRNRWRALFEFRLPQGRPLPDWFVADQMQLFERLEDQIALRLPHLDPQTRRLRARTLFSAVHGIVALGLEEKLVAMPVAFLEQELTAFVKLYIAGLNAEPASRPAVER